MHHDHAVPTTPWVTSFTVDVRLDGERALVTPRGELDLATVPLLERAVPGRDDGVAHVSLDLRELTFFDSTALGLLLRLDEQLRAERRRFGILVGDGFAARVLLLTCTRERFRCEDLDLG